jgi:cation diffusion facilitator CzcD-associated flavoprotein CzcO
LNTDVKECKWLEAEKVWELTLEHLTIGLGDLSDPDKAKKLQEYGSQSLHKSQEIIRAKVVVSAVGGLVEPKSWPDDIPGKEIFRGEIFHSARWKYHVDLKDKNVIVVGTGCSAAQFVPRLTNDYGARSVTQLMRSPPWVVPRPMPPGGERNWAKWYAHSHLSPSRSSTYEKYTIELTVTIVGDLGSTQMFQGSTSLCGF